MKKYLALSVLLLAGSEVVSLAVLCIMCVFALCDFARAADRGRG